MTYTLTINTFNDFLDLFIEIRPLKQYGIRPVFILETEKINFNKIIIFLTYSIMTIE